LQILLIFEILIGSEKNIELLLRQSQKLTIRFSGPTYLRDRRYLMIREALFQPAR
jgi:hypothetical protein